MPPFCKHLIIPNFVKGIKVNAIEITKENEHLLKTGYLSRTEKELPVLERWFPSDKVTTPEAKYLDIILYSKDQIDKEEEAMGIKKSDSNPDYDWGIISIKAQLEDFTLPMSPITMFRNALGKEEGGSGVILDRKLYNDSVSYWKNHANIQ